MRGEGQIAELVAIAEPDVGVIVNVGPVHLELLGTVERVAAAKAELIRDLRRGRACVVPPGEPLLEPSTCATTSTRSPSAPGGDVQLRLVRGRTGGDRRARPARRSSSCRIASPTTCSNTLAAVAAAPALGVDARRGAWRCAFSSLRGEVVELDGGVTVVNDCYNANPMSMRAALEHLAERPPSGAIAVLGGMAELGPDAERFHREIGEHAPTAGDRRADHGRATTRAALRRGLRRRDPLRRRRPRRPATLLEELRRRRATGC